jgi:hypothetical protein
MSQPAAHPGCWHTAPWLHLGDGERVGGDRALFLEWLQSKPSAARQMVLEPSGWFTASWNLAYQPLRTPDMQHTIAHGVSLPGG